MPVLHVPVSHPCWSLALDTCEFSQLLHIPDIPSPRPTQRKHLVIDVASHSETRVEKAHRFCTIVPEHTANITEIIKGKTVVRLYPGQAYEAMNTCKIRIGGVVCAVMRTPATCLFRESETIGGSDTELEEDTEQKNCSEHQYDPECIPDSCQDHADEAHDIPFQEALVAKKAVHRPKVVESSRLEKQGEKSTHIPANQARGAANSAQDSMPPFIPLSQENPAKKVVGGSSLSKKYVLASNDCMPLSCEPTHIADSQGAEIGSLHAGASQGALADEVICAVVPHADGCMRESSDVSPVTHAQEKAGDSAPSAGQNALESSETSRKDPSEELGRDLLSAL